MLYAIAVEHEEALCPLGQTGPEMAHTLADNLEEANLVGVFSMKAHYGVALAEADDAVVLAHLATQILPNHKPAIIREVSPDSSLSVHFLQPERLEDEGNSSRYQFLMLASTTFPEIDFPRTISEQLPTLSLRSLPSYLREHAPAGSHAMA